jgi:predicted kinase
MSRRTYAETLRLAGELLRAGWPVIADGAFSHAAERAEAHAVADRQSAPFTVLWCDAPDEVLVERLRGRSGDRHEVSDGREELLALHRARYETPAAEPGVIRLNTTGDSRRAVEAALLELERSAEG